MEEAKYIVKRQFVGIGFGKVLSAVLVGGLLFFLLLIGLIGILTGIASNGEEYVVQPNSILKLTFNNEIKDRGNQSFFNSSNLGEITTKDGLNNIITEIYRAKEDDNINGIYLQVNTLNAGIATVQEIRNALLDFKQSGKFIISYADYYDQKAYYLATVADELLLNKVGMVEFKGLTAQLVFIKDFLDKIGVKAQVIRHGNYKSAIEPLVQNYASAQNLLQTKVYLESIWKSILTEISTERNISVDDLNECADSLYAFDADMALKKKMVDNIVYEDQLVELLKEKLKLEKAQKISFVNLNQYKNALKEKASGVNDRVAIIYALGEIRQGKSKENVIGDVSLIKEIKKAVAKKSVKAIILRINSPGGSALASENIHREIKIASAAKPVIASMGDLAASGGYYIACAADTILANSTTLTGSIGVFGVSFNAKEMLAEKLGVTIESVNTNQYSDIGSIARSIKEKEQFITKKSVEKVYQTFIERVAKGRDMNLEAVDRIGQGRVWSGANAIENNLVDISGGLSEAINTAKEMAGIAECRLYELPEQKSAIEELLESFGGEKTEVLVKSELGEMYKYYSGIKEMINYNGVMTRLPFEFNIK